MKRFGNFYMKGVFYMEAAQLLDLIDQIDQTVVDSEINVLESLIASYGKSIIILQEGVILDEAKGDKSESMIKRILLFIPRLIKALVQKIGKLVSNMINNAKRKISGKTKDQLITLEFNPFFVAQYVGELYYWHIYGLEYHLQINSVTTTDPESFIKDLIECLTVGKHYMDTNYWQSMEAFIRMTDEFQSLAYMKLTRSRDDFICAMKSVDYHIKLFNKKFDQMNDVILNMMNKCTDEHLLQNKVLLDYSQLLSKFNKNLTEFCSKSVEKTNEIWEAETSEFLKESTDKEMIPYQIVATAWYNYGR